MTLNINYNIKFQIFNIIFLHLLIILYLLVMASQLVQSRNIPVRRKFQQNLDSFPSMFDSYLQAYNDFGDNARQTYPILIPGGIPEAPLNPLIPDPSSIIPPASQSFLPNLNFIADFGQLITRNFPGSPFVRLGRNLIESEECAEYVSCETSKFSLRHSPLNWLHNFLHDFPFQGDIAERLQFGSKMAAIKEGKGCIFKCNPMTTLTRGIKMLSLFNEIVKV